MRLKEGDETAFDRLYSLLKLPLLKFVNGYTGNADASDDIVHNVFLCLYSRPIKIFPIASAGFLPSPAILR